MGKASMSAAGRPEADFKADFDMFCKAKEDTSARRKNFCSCHIHSHIAFLFLCRFHHLYAVVWGRPGTVRVGYADRTHTKAGFNKETSFGISFGRIPIVLAEFQWDSVKVGRRPAGGRF
jgi:hypothetical protein